MAGIAAAIETEFETPKAMVGHAWQLNRKIDAEVDLIEPELRFIV